MIKGLTLTVLLLALVGCRNRVDAGAATTVAQGGQEDFFGAEIGVSCHKIPTSAKIIQRFDPESTKIEMTNVQESELPLLQALGISATNGRYDIMLELASGHNGTCHFSPSNYKIFNCQLRQTASHPLKLTVRAGSRNELLNLNKIWLSNSRMTTESLSGGPTVQLQTRVSWAMDVHIEASPRVLVEGAISFPEEGFCSVSDS